MLNRLSGERGGEALVSLHVLFECLKHTNTGSGTALKVSARDCFSEKKQAKRRENECKLENLFAKISFIC